LCQYLESNGFRCTRLDIALDDYKRRVEFETVKAAGDSGHYRLVKSFKSIQSKICSEAGSVGTCYFGSSDKILRFYNAEFVHGIKADRWELQLRADIAQSAFDVYLSQVENLASMLVAEVDFGIFGKYYRDFVRFDWWESLIQDAGSVYSIPRSSYEPDLSRTILWLDTAVAPTLAVLRSGLGSQFNVFLNQLCNGGDNRLKPYHKKWIETIYESQIDVLKVLQECSK
jgi:DNA relaxase NicK